MENLLCRLLCENHFLILDGAMGTMLQERGLWDQNDPAFILESFNLTHPDIITKIHQEYIHAGSQVIYTNTFGANSQKLKDSGYSVEQIVSSGVRLAKKAAHSPSSSGVLVALDIGPTGNLLEPTGNFSFEDAYDLFREEIDIGISCGVDLIVLETMTDLYEMKAALLAAKEACLAVEKEIPILATMTFAENGRTFTGCSVSAMALTLEGLGADAIGFNCSLGPAELFSLAQELCTWTKLPIIIKPNAGLPDPITNLYHITPKEFALEMAHFAQMGICILGGCCGTTPAYISALKKQIDKEKSYIDPFCRPAPYAYIPRSAVCSYCETLVMDHVHIIGECINPTGKEYMKEALLKGDFQVVLTLGVAQAECGANILDVNIGLPELDEAAVLKLTIKLLQSAITLPLQIDSSDPKALSAGLRAYNGKAIVNSVNGNQASMAEIFPIVKQYGAAVVCLTLDESGIPPTAEGRCAIAKKIIDTAVSYGIPREDIFIDCLAIAACVSQGEARETLRAVRMVKKQLKVPTVLGISNISFGMPRRELLNRSFLVLALESGLTLPILNPTDPSIMDAFRAYSVLTNQDTNAHEYLQVYMSLPESSQDQTPLRIKPRSTSSFTNEQAPLTLQQQFTDAIANGLGQVVKSTSLRILEEMGPQELINSLLIPALDMVGQQFESGKIFLPQLMQSAHAAQEAFLLIKEALPAAEPESFETHGILLASVHGDIHDIGKNIVRVILENYGFSVVDLGKDVPIQTILDAINLTGIRLIGLSALMTTTINSMAQTIAALKIQNPDCKIFVGGAVLTPEYALKIGADFYAKNAMQAVEIAKQVLL